MKVKKYVAPTMPEAMNQVRKELGKDAVILHSRTIQKGGFLGLFRKTNIEVVAAVDPELNANHLPVSTPIEKKPLSSSIVDQTEAINARASNEWQRELQELKTLMEHQTASPTYYPEPIQATFEHLMEQEMSHTLAKTIVHPLLERYYTAKGPVSTSQCMEWIGEVLEDRLLHHQFGGIDYSKQFVHVVGPTGVGKTTTIAKIAAQAVLKHRKSVAFITTDTYRIAAIEQLKTYAKILNVPIEVAYSVHDYYEARQKLQQYDLVLVDTAGRNFRDPQYVKELQKVVDFKEDIQTFLVLSCTSKVKDMNDIYEQFSAIPIKQLIFTKVDETSQFGGVIDLIIKHKLGIAYLTNGQNVPDDIIEASRDILINQIVGERLNERSSS